MSSLARRAGALECSLPLMSLALMPPVLPSLSWFSPLLLLPVLVPDADVVTVVVGI